MLVAEVQHRSDPGREVAPPLWRIHPLVRLHWRQYAHEWVLFEELSGQTHRFADSAAAMMMCFEMGQPLSVAALRQQLVAEFSLDMASDAPLHDFIVQCHALNLIVPAGPDAAA